jgi:hypothetical protein
MVSAEWFVLWFCFLLQFAGTSTENQIEAYSLVLELKVKLFYIK